MGNTPEQKEKLPTAAGSNQKLFLNCQQQL